MPQEEAVSNSCENILKGMDIYEARFNLSHKQARAPVYNNLRSHFSI